MPVRGPRTWRAIAAAAPVLALLAYAPRAHATPAFARRHEVSCNACHQVHYPQLNAFGKAFREHGYQLPDGAEDAARARRTLEPGTGRETLSVFKEVPLSIRGEVFGLVRPQPTGKPASETSVYGFLVGGGSLAKDLSFFFSWSPYPAPALHQARVGLHDLAASWLGPGALNLRAGQLFLLDFQRPTHRQLVPGPSAVGAVRVGESLLNLDDPQLGVQLYGRPGLGPLFYELAIVAGDPGPSGGERDDWKDGFLRLSYTLFQHSSHEVTAGGFGYLGRSDLVSEGYGIKLVHRDDVWYGGGDLELDLGPVNVFGMAYHASHSDPATDGHAVTFQALRAQALVALAPALSCGARYEQVRSTSVSSLERHQLAVHGAFSLATNAVLSLVYRHDFHDAASRSAVLTLDVAL